MMTLLDIDPDLHREGVEITICAIVFISLFIYLKIRKCCRRRRARKRAEEGDLPSPLLDFRDCLSLNNGVEYERSRPRILFQRAVFNKKLPTCYKGDFADLEEDFKLRELSWVTTDINGKEIARRSYTIPPESDENRDYYLAMALRMYRRSLYGCSVVVGYQGDEETCIIAREINSIDYNPILIYKTIFSFRRVAGKNAKSFLEAYRSVMNQDLPETGLEAEAAGLKDCFFEKVKRGEIRLVSRP